MLKFVIHKITERFVIFFELAVGVLLPWKLRCRYSELLLRLERPRWNKIVNNETSERDRDYDRFLHLGYYYLRESKIELAIESLNKALEIDYHNKKTKDVYLLLAKCYLLKGQQDGYIEALINSYKSGRSDTHNKS